MSLDPHQTSYVTMRGHPHGSSITDHTHQLSKVSPGAKDGAHDYDRNVLASPQVVSEDHRSQTEEFRGSVAGKTFVTSPATKKQFLLRSYHEANPPHAWNYTHHPMVGWAELATQALYHAGQIGYLVRPGHVQDHQLPEGRTAPVYVEHLDKSYVPMVELHHDGEHRNLYSQAAKVGMMDFLTNNQDRTQGSLMTRRPEAGPPQLLSTDHARAFQYKRPNRWQTLNPKQDHLMHYFLDSPGMALMARSNHHVWSDGSVGEAVKWWQAHGQNVTSEFEKQVGAIADRPMAGHVFRHFMDRAHALDAFSASWADKPDMRYFSPYGAQHEPARAQLIASAQAPVMVHQPTWRQEGT